MQLHPTTEKVPARRGLPLVVGVLALGFVALLVARPWDPRPAAAPIASPAVAVAVTEAPVDTAVPPTAAATLTPVPTQVPTAAPTPDIAEIGPLGEIALPYTPGEAMAQCDYERHGSRRRGTLRLVSVTVQPPTVLLDSGSSISDIRRVGWYLELQRIAAQRLFEDEWVTVNRSRAQVVGLSYGQATRFAPLTVHLSGAAGETDLFRVRMVIEWYTRNLEVAGRATIVANHYQEGEGVQVGSWPPHCRTFVAARR